MRHLSFFVQFAALMLLACNLAYAADIGDYPKKGDPFPDLALRGEISPEQQEYLGLSGSGPQSLSDINAEAVLIEVFSMYCPFCQREAPKVNELYEQIRSAQGLCADLKVLGIGVGNSEFEVNFFGDKYSIPFPLFNDPDFTIIDRVGQIGTPYFVLVRLNQQGQHETLLSHMGPYEKTEDFFERVKSALCPDSATNMGDTQ